MIVGLYNQAIFDKLFLAKEAIYLTRDEALDLILTEVEMTIWTQKKDGERMVRKFMAFDGPSARTLELFDMFSYIPMISLTDGDEWRTVILDNITKLKVKDQYYFIK